MPGPAKQAKIIGFKVTEPVIVPDVDKDIDVISRANFVFSFFYMFFITPV